MRTFISFSILFAILLTAQVAFAGPGFIPVQGILTDADDNVISGTVDVTFTIYNDGQISVFDETLTIEVDNGFFSAQIGGGNKVLDLTIFRDNNTPTLGIKVGDDAEMSPRLEFGAVPYAVRAEYATNAISASQLNGLDQTAIDGRYVNEMQPNSIASTMVLDGSLTHDDMDVVPLYEVTHPRCVLPPGSLSTSDSCRSYQDDAESCAACTGGQIRVRNCDGSCGCAFFVICPIGQVCDPRSNAPRCPNQPLYAYGLRPQP